MCGTPFGWCRQATAMDFAIGALSGFIGSISYALMYVFTEKVQKVRTHRPLLRPLLFATDC